MDGYEVGIVRRLANLVIIVLVSAFLYPQAPINPYSQGDGFDGQGWAWNAGSNRWEMQFLGAGRPDSVITGIFLATAPNLFTAIGDHQLANNGCNQIITTTTEPLVIRCQVSVNNTYALYQGRLHWRVGNNIRWSGRMGINSTANNCFGWGVSDNATSTSCEFGGNYAMFLYNAATDTNWMCGTRDNVTTTRNNSGVGVDTALHYFNIVETPGVNWKFYIDGVQVCTNTTNIPATGTQLFLNTIARSDGTTAQYRMQYFATQQRLKP